MVSNRERNDGNLLNIYILCVFFVLKLRCKRSFLRTMTSLSGLWSFSISNISLAEEMFINRSQKDFAGFINCNYLLHYKSSPQHGKYEGACNFNNGKLRSYLVLIVRISFQLLTSAPTRQYIHKTLNIHQVILYRTLLCNELGFMTEFYLHQVFNFTIQTLVQNITVF